MSERSSGMGVLVRSPANKGQRWRGHRHPVGRLAGQSGRRSPAAAIPTTLKDAAIDGQGRERAVLDPPLLTLRSSGRWALLVLLRLNHGDPHLVEVAQNILNLFAGELLGGQDLVQLVIGDIAPLLG